MLVLVDCVRFFELITKLAVCTTVVASVVSLYRSSNIVLTTKASHIWTNTKIFLKILVCNTRCFFLVKALRYC